MGSWFGTRTTYGKWIHGRAVIAAVLGAALSVGFVACAKLPCFYTASRYSTDAAAMVADICKRMEAKGTQAVTFAVIEDGRIVWNAALGWRDKEAGLPTTPVTLFNFGSCAKVITTVAMMRLVEQGLVELDEPVQTYLPEFQMADERAAAITVRHLLNHSSGLPGTTLRGAATLEPYHDEHMAIILEHLTEDRLKADPGEFSVYCNDGSSIAEMVIARVSGKRFSQFVKDEVFTPLGMSHSQTADDPYAEGSRVAYRTALTASPYEIMNVHGSGGFSMTASDWCRLLDALARGGVSSKGVRILSEESVAAMAEDQTVSTFWPGNTAGFGLGWDTVSHPAFNDVGIVALSKSGGTYTYNSQVIVIPEYDLGVAISSVGPDPGAADLAVLALERILKRKGIIGGLIDAPAHSPTTALPDELRDYAGYYGRTGFPIHAEFAEDDSLKLWMRQGGEWKIAFEGLTYRENGRFAVDGTADEYFFEELPGGRVLLMSAAPCNGKAPLATSSLAQALAPTNALEEDIAAWKSRGGVWLRANTLPGARELGEPNMLLETFDGLPGLVFFGGTVVSIYSADDTRSCLALPFNAGRDIDEPRIREVNGQEWVRYGEYLYMPISEAVAFADTGETIAIGTEGYSVWRSSADARSFGVTLSGTGARWAVYDSGFSLVGDSLCGDATRLTVPAGGYVEFFGEPGAAFTVSPGN